MIEIRQHGAVCELRFNRPPANALQPAALQELSRLLEAPPDAATRAFVLSGSEGMFTGGLDVPFLLELEQPELVAAVRALFDATRALAEARRPVAAALTGHSPAAGAVLALFCDRRVMADGPYVFGLNEVTIGLPIPEVVAAILTRQVGARAAEDLCLTGRLVHPDEALALGLVDEVEAPDRVVSRCIEWCEGVLALPPAAMAQTRAIVRRDICRLAAELCPRDAEHFAQEWFRPEVQHCLRQLARQLASKRG